MNLSLFSLKYPYSITALSLIVFSLGIFSFFNTPVDLFPDTAPPQIVIITVWPGATSDNISSKITRIIEKEMNSIPLLKNLSSTSRDEVSSVKAEFEYDKSISDAMLDTQNAINKIRSLLPSDIQSPRIFKITDATRPLLTLALSPKPGTSKDLLQIRLLAENQIQDMLLNIQGVAEIDVFGGNKPEISILVDRNKILSHKLTLSQVIASITRHNISLPSGNIYSSDKEYVITVENEFSSLSKIREIPVSNTGTGFIRLKDIAKVSLSSEEQRSFYHGNKKSAIAINLLRADNGDTTAAIKNIQKFLPELFTRFPDIEFSITSDQRPIIELNIEGMKSSLIQAIILTVIVVFLFLANIRTAFIVSLSIPMAFLFSFMLLWFSPWTLNMVTLSGMIIAVGMVVDASVVVIENIFRHKTEKTYSSLYDTIIHATGEVALASTAGMLTTVVVLIPVMFAGGYTQQTMRPLNFVISSTLVASLFCALTIIPLMVFLLFKKESPKMFIEKITQKFDVIVMKTADFYASLLIKALRHRGLVMVIALIFLVFTMRKVKPLLGQELMPPMDTGIVNIDFATPSDYNPSQIEKVLNEIENKIYETPGILYTSSVIGSEPGEISFGNGGSTAQNGRITVTMVDRTKRNQTIWQIQDIWRQKLKKIPGIKNFSIAEYGATPISTTKSPIDIIISGQELKILSGLADMVIKKLDETPGITDIKKSWDIDKTACSVSIDSEKQEFYNVSPFTAAAEIKTAVKGITATKLRLNDYLDIPVTVKYSPKDLNHPSQLRDLYVQSGNGFLPLRAFANISSEKKSPLITREKNMNTIDITAVNRVYTVMQLAPMLEQKLSGISLPEGYSLKVSGTSENIATGQKEMGRALAIGFILLLVLLIAMFRSFVYPFAIVSVIPFAVAGGFWGLLVFDKPMCTPAMMGFILLGGTIVNNSILLLDFILNTPKNISRTDALVNSVRLRTRPILMTTVSTIIGLSPLIFETAVGLERMSPLGIVSATGLLVGTLLTMIVFPVIYTFIDDLKIFLRKESV